MIKKLIYLVVILSWPEFARAQDKPRIDPPP